MFSLKLNAITNYLSLNIRKNEVFKKYLQKQETFFANDIILYN